MARDQPAWVNGSQYAALRAAAAALQVFSPASNLAGARRIGRWMYAFDRRHRERAIENISRSMPELIGRPAAAPPLNGHGPGPRGEVERIALASMQHFLQLGVEVLLTPRLVHRDTWPRMVNFVHHERALDLILSDHPVVMVTGHYGNWEVLGYALSLLGIDLAAIARPIDNPLVNEYLMGVRRRNGMRIITKWGATDDMTGVLERGGTLGFIGDQNAGDKGLFVPFFGRLASAYKSIGLLAIHYGAAVVCGYARRRSGAPFDFEVGIADVIEPADWRDRPDPLFYLTARYTRALETMVRQAPEQYLWIHRRWKSRPRFEREGKPMPERLRESLRSLPWMDEGQIETLAAPAPVPA